MVSALFRLLNTRKPFFVLAVIVAVGAFVCSLAPASGSAQSRERPLSLQQLSRPQDTTSNQSVGNVQLEDAGIGAFLSTWRDGVRVCEVAPEQLAKELAFQRANVIRLNHNTQQELRAEQQQAPLTSLKIVLRGTAQLEQFPQAKQAFLRAAATWESLINTPIQVIVDVDFGPDNFGRPFQNENIIGSTSTQVVGDADAYSEVRSALINRASPPALSSTISRLPS
jgi:hypothetical protein